MADSPMEFRGLGGLGGYPQLYCGTPGFAASAGYTNDLGALLTGPSAAGSIGRGWVKANVATVGTENGVGFGTPGVGVTWGFGPFESSKDYSQPWTRGLIADSANRAGVPSRNNVWEYGYPEPKDDRIVATSAGSQAKVRRLTRMNASNSGNVLASGAFAGEPNYFISPSIGGFDDRSDTTGTLRGPAGGLLGLIQEYIRNNAP